jgi:hypothetical protein
MSTYRLYFTQVISTSIEIEADDLESAIEAAYDSDKMPPGICAQCTGWGQPWNQDVSGEWEYDEGGYEIDGVPVEAAK